MLSAGMSRELDQLCREEHLVRLGTRASRFPPETPKPEIWPGPVSERNFGASRSAALEAGCNHNI